MFERKSHSKNMFSFHFFFFLICSRAKEKRLKKDAGRTRWSQYFRSMKGGSSPRLDKLLDKDELKVDLDSFSHGKYHIFIVYHTTQPTLHLHTNTILSTSFHSKPRSAICSRGSKKNGPCQMCRQLKNKIESIT